MQKLKKVPDTPLLNFTAVRRFSTYDIEAMAYDVDQVAQAALKLLAEVGLDGLTTRRLAGGLQFTSWKARQLALWREQSLFAFPPVPHALGAWRPQGVAGATGLRCG